LDLILTVRKPQSGEKASSVPANGTPVGDLVEQALETFSFQDHQTPSHLYLSLLRQAFERGLPVDAIHLSDLINRLRRRNIQIHPKTGEFVKTA
jgi:hypothetical protein